MRLFLGYDYASHWSQGPHTHYKDKLGETSWTLEKGEVAK